jgi:hypothetical protein
MAQEPQQGAQDEPAGEIDQLFSGALPMQEALRLLRLRLLDLTGRNRLLNFKHSPGKSLQFANASIDQIFERLSEGQAARVSIAPVPEPNREDWGLENGKYIKPDVKERASRLGINPSYELPLAARPGSSLSVLYYPEDAARHCRKLQREARIAIEETGANMLFLVFGFLDFPESPDAEKTYAAPLLSVPVSILEAGADANGVKSFCLCHTGDELAQNLSLREKLLRDFSFELPDFDEDEPPSAYLIRLREAIAQRPNWKLRSHITLALLSFSNMLLVRDLDPASWPQSQGGSTLVSHPIVKQVFEGASFGEATYGQEYEIDAHPKANLPLVYDCDSSQHSALIDALDAKNLVIEGPPGTGKSQTITNLIAAAMSQGKKVLFVAEKLAALEVVKARLQRVGLGDFILELHSNKANKKRVLEDLSHRARSNYRAPVELASQLETLEAKKRVLKAYADLLNSVVGNQQGLTIHQALWRAERYRLRCAQQWESARELMFPAATKLSSAEFKLLSDELAQLANQYRSIGAFDASRPFWGFAPEAFAPGDDLRVERVLRESAPKFEAFQIALDEFADVVERPERLSDDSAGGLLSALAQIAPPGAEAVAYDRLGALFTQDDPRAGRAQEALDNFERAAGAAKDLIARAEGKLLPGCEATMDACAHAHELLATAKSWGLERLSRPQLTASAETLSALLTQALAAHRDIGELGRAVSLPVDETSAGLERMAAALQIAAKAPRDHLRFRHDDLAHPDALRALVRAKEDLNALRARDDELGELFYLDIETDLGRLTEAVGTLREGARWYRVFQSNWRGSIALHRRLDRSKAKKSAGARLAELERLLAHRRARSAWSENAPTRRFMGPHFVGEASPLDEALTVARWLSEARQTCLEAGLSETQLDPLRAREEDLWAMRQREPEFAEARQRLEALSGAIVDLCAGASAARELAREEGWPTRLARAQALVAATHAGAQFLERACPDAIALAEGVSALDAQSRLPEALRALNESEQAKALLGERFAGLASNLAPMRAAIDYGRRVKDKDFPPKLELWLLGATALESHARAQDALGRVRQGWRDVDAFTSAMSALGQFDLEQWAGAGSADIDYPKRLSARAAFALAELGQLMPWTQYIARRNRALSRGLSDYVALLEARAVDSSRLADAFGYRFYASIAQSVFRSSPELASFVGDAHSSVRDEFAQLDRDIIESRGRQIAAAAAAMASPLAGRTGMRVDERTEMALLHYLMPQIRPRMPIRKMIARAGRSIQELKPCFMMGPQAVAQFLEPGGVQFDLLIMDEASQLKPEEALGAIARAKQLIVVGDPKQLPPTSFFSRMAAPGDGDGQQQFAALDSESILDVCMGHFQMRTLRWHYRSRHQSLIAFSNHYFYKNNLIIFPSPFPKSKALGVTYRYLSHAVYEEQSNRIEAARVVDAIIEHMMMRPEDSLGVATLNIKQRDLIADLLEERLPHHPETEKFRARWEAEGLPLFIKNLENVQGDERDVIFVSTTFGKAPGSTVVRQNFGPISRDAGWRRLNVLFTRARKSITVFSSMLPEDIVADAGAPAGTVALRNYLEYARSGVLPSVRATGAAPDSDFEIAVADALGEHGYEVTPQLGVAGFRIDIAVKHPDYASAYLAAVECDGATYHSGVSVRDRDRIRQEILEDLGWKGRIWRIWSTDWFRNPSSETRKLLAFLAELRSRAMPLDSVLIEEPLAIEDATEGAPDVAPLDLDAIQEELEVEVGDLVTYGRGGAPASEDETVRITAAQTNPDLGLIAERTPLAQALLGAAVGGEVTLRVPSKDPQRLVIRSIKKATAEAHA